ncbi:MAG: site-specific DNA-methyltransferase [Vallitaleaceae bacterium]|nr:site-specific DNA-methyltransferase [Vallitaleaceae bacterium]
MSNLENSLHLADCIDLLRDWYSNGQTNFIDLIYIDPPFNSNRNYNVLFDSKLTEEAFQDTWSSISYLDELDGIATMSPNLYNFLKMLETTGLPKSYLSYLTKMSIRCWYAREMLKDTGSLYFHCDPTMSHYVKIMLDYIFGMVNFRNEIVWERTRNTGSSKARAKFCPRNHDIILCYSKTGEYKFNRPIRPFSEEEILWRFPYNENEGKGPYHWNTLASYSQERLENLKKRNELKISSNPNVKHKYSYKVFLNDHKGGIPISDLWYDINPVHGQTKEFIGYPTQKPEKLLERIILTSSNEGDLIADFFMGGGTTIAVAFKLNRNFIGSDINDRALQITQERLESLHQTVKQDFFIYGIPRSSEELRKLVDANIIGTGKNSKFELEEVTVKYYLKDHQVVGNKKKVGDNSIDGYFMFSYQGTQRTGLVQVTSGAGIGHMKAFCSEIGKGTGELGIYVTFADRVSPGMFREAKQYGKIGHVDKIQILTFEDLIDNGKTFEKPQDILKI